MIIIIVLNACLGKDAHSPRVKQFSCKSRIIDGCQFGITFKLCMFSSLKEADNAQINSKIINTKVNTQINRES